MSDSNLMQYLTPTEIDRLASDIFIILIDHYVTTIKNSENHSIGAWNKMEEDLYNLIRNNLDLCKITFEEYNILFLKVNLSINHACTRFAITNDLDSLFEIYPSISFRKILEYEYNDLKEFVDDVNDNITAVFIPLVQSAFYRETTRLKEETYVK